ncbi:methyltransferase [Paenibacillus frigoriresistens]|uniref:methyltransferase n=1 Tax=Paenibacillus alginolyticus TaxID=59839 RepID=UPI001567B125|nr:methyltransferase [Paenibacillus frigoriresistens]NRF95549.1 methyltransferase [Paenibacillus frigoriresistens]
MAKLVRAVLLLFITIQILSACSIDTTATTKSIKYENEKYKFILTLPSKWRDNYDVVELKHEDIMAFRFITKVGKGELFRVEVWPKDQWESKGIELTKIIHISKIGELGDTVYAFDTPTDVQYDPNNQKDKEQYTLLEQDVEQIKASFEVKK